MQFSPTSCHFISLRSKYSQHPVLKHRGVRSSLHTRDQASHPYRTTGKIIILYILIGLGLGYTNATKHARSVHILYEVNSYRLFANNCEPPTAVRDPSCGFKLSVQGQRNLECWDILGSLDDGVHGGGNTILKSLARLLAEEHASC
jgi:hypothetical protein